MKVLVLFLLLLVVFNVAESQGLSKKVVCANKDELLKSLNGRDGNPGPPGLKGEPGLKGDNGVPFGPSGDDGVPGLPGVPGVKGLKGPRGEDGPYGEDGYPGRKGLTGDKGERGSVGIKGEQGECGWSGPKGGKGNPGIIGLPSELKEDVVKSLLSDYYVVESGYHNKLYHVKSRHLTDGRSDTGGWGSETAKSGNWIQASYARPVYVSSVTVAGGFIPSWRNDIQRGPHNGFMDLESSVDGKTWTKVAKILSPVKKEMATHQLTTPITAQYWRLISTEDKWVGTTEFALKPLVKPKPS